MKDFLLGLISLLVTVAVLIGFGVVCGLALGAARGERTGSNPPPLGRKPAAPPPPPSGDRGWVGVGKFRDPDQVQTQPRLPARAKIEPSEPRALYPRPAPPPPEPREPGGESWD